MEISVKSAHQPRVMFFGMQGNFSIPSLQALLDSNIEVCAVVLSGGRRNEQAQPAIFRREFPGRWQASPLLSRRTTSHIGMRDEDRGDACHRPGNSRPLLPVRGSSLHNNIVQMAWQRDIPVFEVRRLRDPLSLTTLAAFAPDMICVACFSQYIPRAVLDIPRLGCLNVHPSLLPDKRGPEPLFWTFRRGDTETGVTIHLMDEGMDSGDILAQEKLPVPDGIDYAQLEAQLARLGGTLLAKTVWQLYEGHAVRVPQYEISRDVGLPCRQERYQSTQAGQAHVPTDSDCKEVESNYLPFPSDQDFIVPVAMWDARHVYNFMRGIDGWEKQIQLRIGEQLIEVERAIAYSFEAVNATPEVKFFWGAKGLWVRCRTGWVCVVTPTNSQ